MYLVHQKLLQFVFNQALSIFLVSIVSNQSKYDDYLAGKVALTADEAEGLSCLTKNVLTVIQEFYLLTLALGIMV